MKLHFVLLLSLFVGQVLAQAVPAQPPTPAPDTPVVADAGAQPLTPETAVITVEGACKSLNAAPGECKTVITRAEFERLMTVLSRFRNGQAQQAIPADAKRQLAIQYSRLLLFASLAEKEGLQSTLDGKELIHFLWLQAMTEELARSIQEKAAPTAQQVQDYYDGHQDRFTEWDFQRIVVPLTAATKGQRSEELKNLAAALQQRASKGDDFDVLQKEAYEKAGVKDRPGTKLVLKPGALLPEGHSAAYRLKPGGVSAVIDDPAGFVIYKLDSRSVLPLDQTKAQIEELVAGEKAQQTIQKLLQSNKVTLNSDYFEAPHQNAGPKTSAVQSPVGPATPTGMPHKEEDR